jgi:sortase A
MIAGLAWLDGMAQNHSAVVEFEQIRERVASSEDQEYWSGQRKSDYRQSLQEDAGATLAILRIPSVNIEVPVFDSIGSIALNRGAGHVAGAASPSGNGNIAIAGHRDGWFRGLKDLRIGAEIELTTLTSKRTFRVSELSIVDPLDVEVLDATDETVLTLITCYPFYYVGSAPDRYIVRAQLLTPNTKRHTDLL